MRHKLIALCTLHKDNFCPRASFHIHFMWEEKHLWYDLSHIQSMLFLFYRKIIIIIFCKSIVDHLRCTKALTHIHIQERTQSVGFWMCSIEFRPFSQWYGWFELVTHFICSMLQHSNIRINQLLSKVDYALKKNEKKQFAGVVFRMHAMKLIKTYFPLSCIVRPKFD